MDDKHTIFICFICKINDYYRIILLGHSYNVRRPKISNVGWSSTSTFFFWGTFPNTRLLSRAWIRVYLSKNCRNFLWLKVWHVSWKQYDFRTFTMLHESTVLIRYYRLNLILAQYNDHMPAISRFFWFCGHASCIWNAKVVHICYFFTLEEYLPINW